MTAAVKTLWTGIRQKSNKPLSVAPGSLSFAKTYFNVDWVTWMNIGYFSEGLLLFHILFFKKKKAKF